MRFILESRQIVPQDIINLNEKMLDIDWSDYSQLDEQLNDLLALEQNFQKFGMTDAVMELVGPSLEAWNIKLDSIDACMESMWDKVKEVSKKIWDAIVAAIHRIGQFFKGLFDRRKKLSSYAGKVDLLTYNGTKKDNGAAQEGFESSSEEFVDKKFSEIVSDKVQIPYDYYIELLQFTNTLGEVGDELNAALEEFSKNPGVFNVELAKRKIAASHNKISKFKHAAEFMEDGSVIKASESGGSKTLGSLGYKYSTFFSGTVDLSEAQTNLNELAKKVSKSLEHCNKRMESYEAKQDTAQVRSTEHDDMRSVQTAYRYLFDEVKKIAQIAVRRSTEGGKIMIAIDNIAIKILKSNGIDVYGTESELRSRM